MTDHANAGEEVQSARRIALVTSQAFSIGNFRGPLIREWVARGDTVFAFAPDYDDNSRAAVRELGAHPVDFVLERAAIRPLQDLLSTVRLARAFRELHVDSVLSYFVKAVIYGSLAARLAGVKNVYAMIEGAGYVFSDVSEGSGLGRRLLRTVVVALYRFALRGVRRVLFLNNDDLQLFVEAGMVKPEQTYLLGAIGVELDRFVPVALVTNPVTFILVGRMLKHKGVEDFVQAAARIREHFPQARFLLVGSPDANPSSVDEVTLRNWCDRGLVEWVPHVDDVRPWLARASVFVLPSWYREGVPRSIQEAMAMGRPVVTSDMPGCRDTVEHGVSGFLVPPRDLDALVQALERFLLHPDLVQRMGRESRSRAEQHFDVNAANARLLEAIEMQNSSAN